MPKLRTPLTEKVFTLRLYDLTPAASGNYAYVREQVVTERELGTTIESWSQFPGYGIRVTKGGTGNAPAANEGQEADSDRPRMVQTLLPMEGPKRPVSRIEPKRRRKGLRFR